MSDAVYVTVAPDEAYVWVGALLASAQTVARPTARIEHSRRLRVREPQLTCSAPRPDRSAWECRRRARGRRRTSSPAPAWAPAASSLQQCRLVRSYGRGGRRRSGSAPASGAPREIVLKITLPWSSTSGTAPKAIRPSPAPTSRSTSPAATWACAKTLPDTGRPAWLSASQDRHHGVGGGASVPTRPGSSQACSYLPPPQ
jgi:hypothetical protein